MSEDTTPSDGSDAGGACGTNCCNRSVLATLFYKT